MGEQANALDVLKTVTASFVDGIKRNDNNWTDNSTAEFELIESTLESIRHHYFPALNLGVLGLGDYTLGNRAEFESVEQFRYEVGDRAVRHLKMKLGRELANVLREQNLSARWEQQRWEVLYLQMLWGQLPVSPELLQELENIIAHVANKMALCWIQPQEAYFKR